MQPALLLLGEDLARKLLAGEFKEGDTIKVERGGDGVTFSAG